MAFMAHFEYIPNELILIQKHMHCKGILDTINLISLSDNWMQCHRHTLAMNLYKCIHIYFISWLLFNFDLYLYNHVHLYMYIITIMYIYKARIPWMNVLTKYCFTIALTASWYQCMPCPAGIYMISLYRLVLCWFE